MSLACAYANGIGVEFDIPTAADYVVQAAALGDKDAQSVYISTFSWSGTPKNIHQDVWCEWLRNAADAGNVAALDKLRNSFPLVAKEVIRSLQDRELRDAGVPIGIGANDTAPIVTKDTPKDHLQAMLLQAVVENNKEAVQKCVEVGADLMNMKLANDEHALLTACRLGKFEAAQGLVTPQNADLGNEKGVRPLHWLSSFPEDKQLLMAKLLLQHGASLDPVAAPVAQTDYGLKTEDGSYFAWTPLHWSVVADSPSSVTALLEIGCDPTFRAEDVGQHRHMTPLELACVRCCPAALSALLRHKAVRTEVNTPRRLVPAQPVMVRPLFWLLQSTSRWDRLRQVGPQFEAKTRDAISQLLESGARTDAVLQFQDIKMSAAFATAFHGCCADVMASGLQLGFSREIGSTFGPFSSGGSAFFLAITHGDRDMFTALLRAGADPLAHDQHGLTPLHRAAKENDDVFFSAALLDAGAPVDPEDSADPSAFFLATYSGNYKVARLLFDKGADRDRIATKLGRSILGEMLHAHTRNSLRRVKFLLDLPDRGEHAGGGTQADPTDGFIAARLDGEAFSALHLAVPYISEFSKRAEITGIMVSRLLAKFHDKAEHLDNTHGPHGMTVLAVATEIGDHGVVRRLLQAGADPNVPDRFGRTALDLLYQRYCYPERVVALEGMAVADERAVGRVLAAVNANTSEILSLLTSYKAEAKAFRFPGWFEGDSGYRSLAWVLERLKEKKKDAESVNVKS